MSCVETCPGTGRPCGTCEVGGLAHAHCMSDARCEHLENTTPNSQGSCVKCGHPMPPVDKLADRVEEAVPHIRAGLEGANVKKSPDEELMTGADGDWAYFYALTMHRVRNVGDPYRETWRERDMPKEAIEEASDLWVYLCGEIAKRGGDEDGHLYKAALHAYEAYKAIRQHQAEMSKA